MEAVEAAAEAIPMDESERRTAPLRYSLGSPQAKRVLQRSLGRKLSPDANASPSQGSETLLRLNSQMASLAGGGPAVRAFPKKGLRRARSRVVDVHPSRTDAPEGSWRRGQATLMNATPTPAPVPPPLVVPPVPEMPGIDLLLFAADGISPFKPLGAGEGPKDKWAATAAPGAGRDPIVDHARIKRGRFAPRAVASLQLAVSDLVFAPTPAARGIARRWLAVIADDATSRRVALAASATAVAAVMAPPPPSAPVPPPVRLVVIIPRAATTGGRPQCPALPAPSARGPLSLRAAAAFADGLPSVTTAGGGDCDPDLPPPGVIPNLPSPDSALDFLAHSQHGGEGGAYKPHDGANADNGGAEGHVASSGAGDVSMYKAAPAAAAPDDGAAFWGSPAPVDIPHLTPVPALFAPLEAGFVATLLPTLARALAAESTKLETFTATVTRLIDVLAGGEGQVQGPRYHGGSRGSPLPGDCREAAIDKSWAGVAASREGEGEERSPENRDPSPRPAKFETLVAAPDEPGAPLALRQPA